MFFYVIKLALTNFSKKVITKTNMLFLNRFRETAELCSKKNQFFFKFLFKKFAQTKKSFKFALA
ncbi:hypothetical protein B8T70_10970 [Flavobacterium sp. AJR]|nr:hypothetical protein B8T70_10970 [Flavobacterium sp. AJR]